MRPLITPLALLLLAVTAFAADAADRRKVSAVLTGIATVKNGAGILFGQVEIRLQGIAAPEDPAPGAAESAANLAKIVNGETVRCELDGTIDGSSRPAAACFLNQHDLGEVQVRSGHARDCPNLSGGRYQIAEQQARAEGKKLSAIYQLPAYCLDR